MDITEKLLEIKKKRRIFWEFASKHEEAKDMDREKKIEEAVEKALGSFGAAEKLQAPPFFFAQVKAKIEGYNCGRNRAYGSVFGALRFASLILLVAVNIVTATYFLQSDLPDAYERSQMISVFAQEYALEVDD